MSDVIIADLFVFASFAFFAISAILPEKSTKGSFFLLFTFEFLLNCLQSIKTGHPVFIHSAPNQHNTNQLNTDMLFNAIIIPL